MMYAIKKIDGSVSIMRLIPQPVLDEEGNPTGETWLPKVSDEIEKWHEDDRAKVVSWREITPDALPADRDFRNAWTDDFDTPTIDVHMDRAKEIHMGRIRELRNAKLKELDIQTLKGIDVQAQKQVLRDIPQTLDLSAAKTPDELKAIIPDELK